MNLSEMDSLSNCRWQNCKECPNRFTNHGDMTEIAKSPVGYGVRGVCAIYVINEKLSF